MSSGLQLDWSKFFNLSKNGSFELVDTNVVKKLCPILRSRKLHFKSNTCILKKGEQKDKKCELLNKIVNAHQYPHAIANDDSKVCITENKMNRVLIFSLGYNRQRLHVSNGSSNLVHSHRAVSNGQKEHLKEKSY